MQTTIEKAKAHYEDIKTRYQQEIEDSIKNSGIYGPEMPQFYMPSGNLRKEIILSDEDSVSCLFKDKQVGKVAILNFASYKNPGGGYLNGMTTQEEDLCHKSTLYPVLLSFVDSYYNWNRKNLNRGLYRNRAIYSPNIIFEYKNQKKEAEVITCAAPNAGCAIYKCDIPEDHNKIILKDRIRFLFKVADVNEVDILIAGAWGCGVFMQNPYEVASLMKDEFMKGGHKISTLYWAIPGGGENYDAFEECINS